MTDCRKYVLDCHLTFHSEYGRVEVKKFARMKIYILRVTLFKEMVSFTLLYTYVCISASYDVTNSNHALTNEPMVKYIPICM